MQKCLTSTTSCARALRSELSLCALRFGCFPSLCFPTGCSAPDARRAQLFPQLAAPSFHPRPPCLRLHSQK